MTRKKSWLARLDEIDQRDQSRLDHGNNFVGVSTIFQPGKKRRSGKQAEKEKTMKLAFVVYMFFVIEICTIGGLLLADSGDSGFGSTIAVFVWSAILSVFNIVIGIIGLIMRPHVLYIHIPFILNFLLFLIVFIGFAF